MLTGVELENIEEMRQQAGIDDVELRHEIRSLEVGDFVLLTLLGGDGSRAAEAWLARITSIEGSELRGKLARPVSPGPSRHRAGVRVAFRAAHIHSVPRGKVSSD